MIHRLQNCRTYGTAEMNIQADCSYKEALFCQVSRTLISIQAHTQAMHCLHLTTAVHTSATAVRRARQVRHLPWVQEKLYIPYVPTLRGMTP